MFSKKKGKEESKGQNNPIIGMIMLSDDAGVDADSFWNDFKNNYDHSISAFDGDKAAFAFNTEEEHVAIAYMPFPIPQGDIEGTAQYAYNWETAVEDLENHKSHLLVTIMRGGTDQVKRFRILTRVISSLLRTTNSIGVYEGSQSLLIPKDDFLYLSEAMTDEHYPLNLWIYFGFRRTENGFGAYTYGLKAFGKYEMEIVDSGKSIEDIEKFLFNMTHYVLDYDVTFADGQTCGMSAEEKIPISFSEGVYVEGESFKLQY